MVSHDYRRRFITSIVAVEEKTKLKIDKLRIYVRVKSLPPVLYGI